ncbi:MAG: four helix bundle protein [Saprospiraceae bacterium]
MAFKDFTSMSVWHKAHELVLDIYTLTDKFPNSEKFGMISDMRRAANTVLHNIAEGFGRYENRDKTRFYKISRGSAYELISQSITACSLSYIANYEKERLAIKCKTIIGELNLLIKTVETR